MNNISVFGRLGITLLIIALVLTGIRIYENKTFTDDTKTYDRISRVRCETRSMGNILDCNDTLKSIKTNINDTIILNGIYIYDNGNGTTAHRALCCPNNNCSTIVFKGDNNTYAEIVDRSQIKYEVKEIIKK